MNWLTAGRGCGRRRLPRVRAASPGTTIEVLIPDFCGDWDALQKVLDAKPDIFNHNTETVPSQYKTVRPQAKYERTLELLSRAKAQGFITKTGLMAGIGETDAELLKTFRRHPGGGCRYSDDWSIPAADARAFAYRPLGDAGAICGVQAPLPGRPEISRCRIGPAGAVELSCG